MVLPYAVVCAMVVALVILMVNDKSASFATSADVASEDALTLETHRAAVSASVVGELVSGRVACGDEIPSIAVPSSIDGPCALDDYSVGLIAAMVLDKPEFADDFDARLDTLNTCAQVGVETLTASHTFPTQHTISGCDDGINLLLNMAASAAETHTGKERQLDGIDDDLIEYTRSVLAEDPFNDDDGLGRHLLGKRCIDVSYSKARGWRVDADLICIGRWLGRIWRKIFKRKKAMLIN